MLAGHGQGALRLEIEMLLGTAGEFPLSDIFTSGEGGGRVAGHALAPLAVDKALGRGLARVKDGFQRLYVGLYKFQGQPRGALGLRHHQRYGLADILHAVRGQQGMVLHHVPDLVEAGHVLMRINRGHAGRCGGFGHVQRPDPAAGHGRSEKDGVQTALRSGYVVYEARGAAHVHQHVFVLHTASPAAAGAVKWARTSRPSSSFL